MSDWRRHDVGVRMDHGVSAHLLEYVAEYSFGVWTLPRSRASPCTACVRCSREEVCECREEVGRGTRVCAPSTSAAKFVIFSPPRRVGQHVVSIRDSLCKSNDDGVHV